MNNKMKRVYPYRITDKHFLSKLLFQYLHTLMHSPFELSLTNLAWDTQIPIPIWQRLMDYHRRAEEDLELTAQDFHIAFAHLFSHYPTVRIWRDIDQQIYIAV
jgi:hypothetical protein